MRVQVLGPLRVTSDGEELQLGGPQQRLVLALLIAAEGRTVSTDTLIEGVWGEEVPTTARKALQGYVHHLRAQLGDSLTTQGNGYAFIVGEVDAREFEELVDRANLQPIDAAEVLRQALGLWNGAAYADLRDSHGLLPEVARLENLRLEALASRIDADLALGRHGVLIGELEGLILEHPFRERFRAQHMTALYRAGRHTEALRSYERHRRFLADESGLEPSAELKRLEELILSQDASLEIDALPLGDEDPAAIRGYELRDKIAEDEVSETFRAYQRSVGRLVAIRIIGPELANDPTFIANFLSDTQRIAAVEHPHISYVFDTWREPGRAYQVSRWLGGGTLENRLTSASVSSPRLLLDVGAALAQAHRVGVVHGSVDAGHVQFDESGHAYLTGFQVGSGDTGDPADDRVDFAALAHRVVAGRPPRRGNGGLRPDLDGSVSPGVVAVFEVAFSDDGYVRVEDFLRALKQALGIDVVGHGREERPRVETRNPYKGLQAFQESDADDFYGRDGVIDRLVDTLASRRLVAVVGPSGSGKSSVVKAGLISSLRQGNRLRLFTEMYPGAFPFEELEGALLRVGVERTSLIEDLIADDRGLLRVLKQILPSDDTELVLVIDQFEELFSTVDDPAVEQLFLDSLVTALSDPHSKLRVVVTLRADFFGRPLEHPAFGELVESGLVPVSLPADKQLAQAIAEPARSVGVEFEGGLVSQIVQDVSGQAGGLPLLQYALTELFEARESNTLTLAAYRGGGGVHGVLGRRAEEMYESLTPLEQAAVRQAFLRMVSVDESADDLRRRIRRSDLIGIGEQQDLDSALQAYAAARLITFDRDPVTRGPTVEVAHEALLREWPRLRDWIDELRDDLIIRRRLDAVLEEWKQSGEDDGYLPTGSRLAQFEEWAGQTDLALSGAERAFLQAGVEREAELRARAGRRRRWVMTGFGAVAVVASILGLLALRNADVARAEALAAAAVEQIDQNPERSVLLALQSLSVAETPNGLAALHQALQGHRTLWTAQSECPTCPSEFTMLHPDGRHVLTMTSTGRVRYWDTLGETDSPMWTVEITDGRRVEHAGDLRDHRGWIDTDSNRAVIPVSDLLANPSVQGEHRGLYVLDLETGRVVDYRPIDGCVARHFFPRASSTVAEPVLAIPVWDTLPDDQATCNIASPPSGFEVRADAFVSESVSLQKPENMWGNAEDMWWDLSVDGRLFVFSEEEAGAFLFDARTGELIETFPEAWRATLSPDGEEILLYGDNTRIVEIDSGEEVGILSGDFWWAEHTPDEQLLVGLTFAGDVEVFDTTQSSRPLYNLTGPEAQPSHLRFGGRSDRVLVASADGYRLWSLQSQFSELTSTPERVMPHGGFWPHIGGVTVHEELLFTPTFTDQGIGYALYESDTGELIRQGGPGWAFMPGYADVILELPILEFGAVAPSGWEGLLVGRPRLVEPQTGEVISQLPSTCTFYSAFEPPRQEPGPDCEGDDIYLPITNVAFSADGALLAVDTLDGKPTVFDIENGTLLYHDEFGLDPSAGIRMVALSPDGTTLVYQTSDRRDSETPRRMTAVDVSTGEVTASAAVCDGNAQVLFSEDGTEIYTADFCSDIAVFDATDLTEIARFGRGQGAALNEMAVHGDLVATTADDNTIRVWDLQTRAVLLEVELASGVGNVEFIDDAHIAVFSYDGDVLTFTLDPEELKAIAFDRVTRGLTEEECAIYDIDSCPTLEEMEGRS